MNESTKKERVRSYGPRGVVPGLILIGLLGCGPNGDKSGETTDGELGHMRDSGYYVDLPRNPDPLERGYGSPEELVDTLLAALARQDTTRLVDLAISPDEWRKIFYPELGLYYPDARDDRPEIMETLGELHFGASVKGVHRVLRDYGGMRLYRADLRFNRTLLHPSFTLHEGSLLVVSTPTGDSRSVTFLGSIVEKDGVFKLLSYRESDQEGRSREE